MAAQIRSLLPSFTPLPNFHHHRSSPSPFPRIYHIACQGSTEIASGPNSLAFSVASAPSPLWCSFSTTSNGHVGLISSRVENGVVPQVDCGGGDGRGSFKGSGGDGGEGDDKGRHGHGGQSDDFSFGLFSVLVKGWNDRVTADPQFPFKVLMEEVVGVGANVLGDMASRPNFGLNELDFVFSTIVVGSILNFSLMYMLAPTSITASAASTLPSIFASCPAGHMFEHGAYSVLDRLGTFVYKGVIFAAVGFGAGLLGTAISNVLIGMRKKLDPTNEVQVKVPPTVLNAATWALHMGLSSNFRYQLVNGLEFAMAKAMPPSLFKISVFGTRAMNNVIGGMSFVFLARLTGSQKPEEADIPAGEPEMRPINPEVHPLVTGTAPITHANGVSTEADCLKRDPVEDENSENSENSPH